ncbi:MAG: hypothetical protein GTO54_02370, partial [Nitrososphaeria archaeon]|nr:hypothetical protein [Nitrososphaeria archaeon]
MSAKSHDRTRTRKDGSVYKHEYTYYRCNVRAKSEEKAIAAGIPVEKIKAPHTRQYRADIVDEALWRYVVSDIVQHPDKYLEKWQNEVATGKKQSEIENRIAQHTKDLELQQKRLERALENAADPSLEISREMAKRIVLRVQEECDRLQKDLAADRAELERLRGDLSHYADMEALRKKIDEEQAYLYKTVIPRLLTKMSPDEMKAFIKSVFTVFSVKVYQEKVEPRKPEDFNIDEIEQIIEDIAEMKDRNKAREELRRQKAKIQRQEDVINFLEHVRIEAEYNEAAAVAFLGSLMKDAGKAKRVRAAIETAKRRAKEKKTQDGMLVKDISSSGDPIGIRRRGILAPPRSKGA